MIGRLTLRASACALALLSALPALAQQAISQPAPPAMPPALIGNDTQYYTLGAYSTAVGSIALGQNSARCSPFYAPYAFHADQAGVTVTTLGTGPLNFALYTDAIDATTHRHQPQTLITNPNVTFVVTSTGNITTALGTGGVGVAVPQGLNWACVNDTNAADAVRFDVVNSLASSLANLIGSNAQATATTNALFVSMTATETAGTTTTNWPSLAGVTFTDNASNSFPVFALRVATAP